MTEEQTFLSCYNRGCGKKFDPNDNKDGDCIHHRGYPVFHDAYKGWSCCNKKCTDFTEFLNIKGCTKSRHTNEKPAEPEKPVIDKSKVNEIIKVNAKVIKHEPALKRPPFHSPQVTLKPNVSSTLLEQIKELTIFKENSNENIVLTGQSCKNNSCKATYTESSSDEEECIYHPGVPIFHEGMKYWSCCNKRTTDFGAFLEQVGCAHGKHIWYNKDEKKKVQCRMDWHQTGMFVIVSVYAKKYQPSQSYIKLNPIHLTIDLFLMTENARYKLDLELKGIVDVDQSSVNMLPSKVEIKLKKAEPGSWPWLDIPKIENDQSKGSPQNNENSTQIETIDLSDI